MDVNDSGVDSGSVLRWKASTDWVMLWSRVEIGRSIALCYRSYLMFIYII
jgi:hypothetical protein